MNDFYDELIEGNIQLRDKFQFELKSEYSPHAEKKDNLYTSEFFIFVPASLQINPQTYSKQQFYYDQTNFIRLKTPRASIKDLYDTTKPTSPLSQIKAVAQTENGSKFALVLNELKLYANIVRSTLRKTISQLLSDYKKDSLTVEKLREMLHDVIKTRKAYFELKRELGPIWETKKGEVLWRYIDEFLSITIESYLLGISAEIKHPNFSEVRTEILDAVEKEIEHRKQNSSQTEESVKKKGTSQEYFIYRSSLLKKFVYECLFLSISRKEPVGPLREIAAGFAAAIAMLFYLVVLALYVENFRVLVFDSAAFIVLSVMLYVLKDRIKDGIKVFSGDFFTKHFPDYKTKIRTPDGKTDLGTLTEYFSFRTSDQLPSEIQEIRNTKFHTVLEEMERREQCIYFKKDISLTPVMHEFAGQFYELNDIFRYNISRYLLKAGDSYKEHLRLHPVKKSVEAVRSPKVYHINIIMRQTYYPRVDRKVTRISKVRIILDKEGIKRIEDVE